MNTQSSDPSFASKRCGQHLTQPTSQKWPADTTKLYIWFATSSSYFNQQNIYERGLPQYYLFYLLFPVCCCCYVCPVRDKTKKKKIPPTRSLAAQGEITEKTNDRRSKNISWCAGEKKEHTQVIQRKTFLTRRRRYLFFCFLSSSLTPAGFEGGLRAPTTKQKK